MLRTTFVLILMAIFIVSCQPGKEDAKNFSTDYTKLTEKLRDMRSKVKTRDDYVAYNTEKDREYTNLLQKYEASPSIEEIEILRSKVLLKLKKLDEAEKIINQVLTEGPEHIVDAKLTKALILIEQKKFDDAYQIFKDIESQVTDPYDLFLVYYYLGTEHNENKVKQEYAEKFLNTAQMPDYFKGFKANMYLTLTSVAKQDGDFEKARQWLNQGIANAASEGDKASLTKALEQLDDIGKDAFSISAPTWINSVPLQLKDLKDRVVVLAFWAPWCPSCRGVMPSLVKLYNDYKDKGLDVIGYTRLYGTYKDDKIDAGQVTKDEEIQHIRTYIERAKMIFPVAITEEKTDYANYKISAIPTLVFINKQGKIDFSEIGGTNTKFLEDKIKSLLQ